jgi:hypothetical protein
MEGEIDRNHPEIRCCDECGSDYFAAASQMFELCPECARWLKEWRLVRAN